MKIPAIAAALAAALALAASVLAPSPALAQEAEVDFPYVVVGTAFVSPDGDIRFEPETPYGEGSLGTIVNRSLVGIAVGEEAFREAFADSGAGDEEVAFPYTVVGTAFVSQDGDIRFEPGTPYGEGSLGTIVNRSLVGIAVGEEAFRKAIAER